MLTHGFVASLLPRVHVVLIVESAALFEGLLKKEEQQRNMDRNNRRSVSAAW